jgi:methylenetetrahydrofolate dehydrogenase (NADP+)/methenyltetrahydrofolate cyclohydrolase
MRLIAHTGIDPRGKSATVLANSGTFALPLSHLLQKAGFATTIMDPDALDREILATSDVIVSAVGRCGFVGRDLVKEGVILIDVGTSKGPDGKTCGDVDAADVDGLSGWRSPVPGGVGPMTVALLLKNVVNLKKLTRG